ncbi:MAG: L-lactate dehydrogenase [Eubacteriales bacterium]|nr:L-lactate dehydrogenase [Eubacteriales bacterium]
MNKITIVGSGNVGATIAYTLTTAGTASEIVMIDVNDSKSLGEALDIRQGTPFCHPCQVYAGSYSDAVDSDIVVITSGMARKADQSRLDLAQANVDVLKSIAPQILKYAPNATYVIVSNPVDILTYAFSKYSGLPDRQIIGSGTILDTARLRSRISEYYAVNQQNVHAYVLGEHGDSSFIPWSIANISNVPIEQYADCLLNKEARMENFDKAQVEEYVRSSGAKVISRKGATFYAVSMSVAHICKCLLSGIDTTLTVSTMLHGEYGIEDVCLSLLNIVGNTGAHSKVMLPLNDEELKALHHSAETLKGTISQIKI